MKNSSTEWLQTLMHPVNRKLVGDDPLHSQFPIFPWITPWVHPSIVDLIMHCGIERELDAGQQLFGSGEKISSLVYVTSGVTGALFSKPKCPKQASHCVGSTRTLCCRKSKFLFASSRYRTLLHTHARQTYLLSTRHSSGRH